MIALFVTIGLAVLLYFALAIFVTDSDLKKIK